MKKILAADIGGTSSRFASFSLDENGILLLAETEWLSTAESSSFGHLMEMLKQSGFPLEPDNSDAAVFAIAGPVDQGVRCSPPFINWDVDISKSEKGSGLTNAVLINDFVAQAYACRSIVGENAEQIKSGKGSRHETAAVIGAGTALGKAVIFPDGMGGFHAIPSEGGHANFPFEGEREFQFQEFLIRELGDKYITWNKVVCGAGLARIHDFLTGRKLDPREVIEQIIPDSETLAWAARFYGRACRNFTLETLATGGLFIAGGVAARTPELVKHEAFISEFVRSDTLSDLLLNVPIFLVKEQNAGLWGAAFLGQQLLAE